MTIELLNKIFKENNIPSDAKLMSDSGWDCNATEMEGIYYNPKTNTVVFTQRGSVYESYFEDFTWKLLYQSPRTFEEESRWLEKGLCNEYERKIIIKRRNKEEKE